MTTAAMGGYAPRIENITDVYLISGDAPPSRREAVVALLRETGYVLADQKSLDQGVHGLRTRAGILLSGTDAVALVPGWEGSVKARAEAALAVAAGLPAIDGHTGLVVDIEITAETLTEEDREIRAAMQRHPAGKGSRSLVRPDLSVVRDIEVAYVHALPEKTLTPCGARACTGCAACIRAGVKVPGITPVEMPRNLPRIGLLGYAQVGKDTVGQILVEEHGYALVSPSDVLREFLYIQNGYLPTGERVRDVVDEHGWEQARRIHPYLRELQQQTGTEAGRNVLGEDVWIDVLTRRVQPGDHHVSGSCRYPNEALWVTEARGVTIRVTRPGVEAINGHDSDNSMDDWPADYEIANDGTLDDLRRKVAALMERLAAGSAA